MIRTAIIKHLHQTALCLLVWVILTGAASAQIRVFAAASLKTALDDVAAAYTQQTGQTLTLTYAGSSILARQIRYGAPADLFLSANLAWMEQTSQQGHVAARQNLLSNQLVLVGAPDAAPLTLTPQLDLISRLQGGRLAMALVQAVPAGIYGHQALTSLGLWDQVAPHVAQTDNVRAALRLVSTGATPMGIVYRTDALADPNVAILATFPANSHSPITYPAALLTQASPEAGAFWSWLTSDAALHIFLDHGFLPAGTPQ